MLMNQTQQQDIGIYLDLEPPDVREGEQEPRISLKQNEKQMNVTKKVRTSNYVFKSPLRLFINVILKFEGPDFLGKQVRAIVKEKNLQTFPKLVCLCQRLGIRNQICQIWSREAQIFLSAKHRTVSSSGYVQLLDWTNRMSEALVLNDWAEFVEKYWGDKVRHKDKLNKCIQEIERISNYQY